MKYTCDIKIPGLYNRMWHIKDECTQIGMSLSNVIFDDRGADGGDDAWGNAINCWQYPSETTHRCVIEDDCDVVPNLMEIINIAINQFPDAIFGLYGRTWVPSSWEHETPYAEIKNHRVTGQGIIMPKKYIDDMIIYTELMSGGKLRNPDERVSFYAYTHNIKIISFVPSLVGRHPGIKSARKHAGKWKSFPEPFIGKSAPIDAYRTLDIKPLKGDYWDLSLYRKRDPIELKRCNDAMEEAKKKYGY